MYCRCGAILGFLATITAAAPVINIQSAIADNPSIISSAQQSNVSSSVGSTASSSSSNSGLKNYGGIVAFGASYEDNGHPRPSSYSFSLSSSPYVGGRHCNGPVMVEYLVSNLGSPPFYDYAYSGAMIDNSLMGGNVPASVNQIATFTSDNPTLKYNSGRRLYVYWTGINNILAIWNGVRYNLDSSTGLKQVSAALADVASQISSLQSISDGSVHDILLLPLPPLETTPVASYTCNYDSKQLALLSQLTSAFNSGIATIVSNAAANAVGTGSKILTFDIVGLWRNAIATPSIAGLNNAKDPCYTGAVCSTPNTYLYWDTLHPTTAFNSYAAKLIASYITSAL